MATNLPLVIQVEYRRLEGLWHVIAAPKGSPKLKRKTLCGVSRGDTLPAAAFALFDERSPFFSEVGCATCQERLAV